MEPIGLNAYEKWSCSAETFTDAATSKVLMDVCKSIKKK